MIVKIIRLWLPQSHNFKTIFCQKMTIYQFRTGNIFYWKYFLILKLNRFQLKNNKKIEAKFILWSLKHSSDFSFRICLFIVTQKASDSIKIIFIFQEGGARTSLFSSWVIVYGNKIKYLFSDNFPFSVLTAQNPIYCIKLKASPCS